LLIKTEDRIATFRSVTRDLDYQQKKTLRPNMEWYLDNSMVDANVQQMRQFHLWLKHFLSRN